MSNANGIITAPVSIDDVKTVLGIASNDLATLCQSTKINIWAKYKPVCFNQPFANNSGKGQDATNIPYGLKLATTGDSIQGLGVELSYKKPSGGASEPFRLGDFAGYNHNCAAPWIVNMPDNELYKNSNKCLVSITAKSLLPDGNLTVEDVFPNGGYPGVAVTSGSGLTYYKTTSTRMTASTTQTIDCMSCSLISGASAGDTLTITAFISSSRIEDWSDSATTLYGLAYSGMITQSSVTIKAPVVNTHTISVWLNGLKRNNVASFNGTDVYASVPVLRKWTGVYTLNSITETTTLNGTVVSTTSVDITGAEPQELMYETGVRSITFRCRSVGALADRGYNFDYDFDFE